MDRQAHSRRELRLRLVIRHLMVTYVIDAVKKVGSDFLSQGRSLTIVPLGHWIQQCPTNADPQFDGRPRVKRTTGIPKSFLKTVEKPVPSSDQDGASSNPASVMVNADGEFVVAEPDKASWESYQQKAKS